MEKIKVLFVYNNFGIGGIAKALTDVLRLLDYSRYDVTLYIRRDDVLDLIDKVPPQVKTVIIKNEVKSVVFENNISGKIVKLLYNLLKKGHKHLAKQLFLLYKYPIQRKKEKQKLKDNVWDIAISYSTDGDDPIFVKECVNANKKYVFVHQSTKIAKKNIKAMKKYDGIITVNPLLVPWVSSFMKSSERVYAIENYVDYEKIKVLAAQDSPVLCNKTVIATCGRLCITKGFDYVVNTAKLLSDDNKDFVWYWIGDGPAKKEMEQRIKELKLEDKIIITGFQKNPYTYMNACDIYVQPSRAESFGLAILEAFVLEKPVITTKTAGGKHIYEKYGCGILVNESPEEIADEINKLITSKSNFESEKEKTRKIDWEKEKERYSESWSTLLNGTMGR